MKPTKTYHRPMKDCRECGKLFLDKGNKHFCATRCKNTHNNRERRAREVPLKEKDKALRYNYRVLKKLLGSPAVDITAIPKQLLDYEGFDFLVYTSLLVNEETGQVVICVYNLGIEENKGGKTFCLHFIDAAGHLI